MDCVYCLKPLRDLPRAHVAALDGFIHCDWVDRTTRESYTCYTEAKKRGRTHADLLADEEAKRQKEEKRREEEEQSRQARDYGCTCDGCTEEA